MISSDVGSPSTAGVATAAKLYSGGFPTANSQPTEAATAHNIALQNSGDIRAINISYNTGLANQNVKEGNSLFTQFIDWSARQHNTLYITGGAQLDSMGMPFELPVPHDQYNGINVGKSSKNATTGVYDRVNSGNDYSQLTTERTHVDILAPGVDVLVGSLNNATPTVDGTSFAAPHVTGTVALLQQYGDARIAAGAANWTRMATSVPEPGFTARRHEVMKSVLMNSADKLIDDGSVTIPGGLAIPAGGLLGMDRTVVRTDGSSTWLDSPSWDDSVDSGTGGFVPLDVEMGTGHLNAERALQQFAAGEHEEFEVAGGRVPTIGWDYGTTTGDGHINRYRFNQELQAGSFISITLTWDRVVEFDNDANMDGNFDIGDTFVDIVDPSGIDPRGDEVFNDLSLFFLPQGGVENQARAFSTSVEGTTEHIFFQVETTGDFEFWVRQEDEDVGVNQNYAVSWWALGTGPQLVGDFDFDDDVDGDDLVVWEENFGLTGFGDSDADGDTDGADFFAWQRNYTGPGAISAVPEPTCVMLLAMGLPILLGQRRPKHQ